ncbi:unnamed protein product [Fusarium graminearum]|uniref:Chromosome 3, complete genome n=1 Tax=Gibberella zeae (strain ATCC MYA-4620 / CBS 123657 / FGSC 9075 / NRRL 31084 / PH-1) TaxID=229533 RepID=I1S758_GIBZE|nr:hypothetical protein FGSG_12681 [Fusarium graminearum PH-1]ESU10994.1 hypothetical protein FGSG_12681 [Fusarium graminearum PH-1]CEF86824.1 unnamed protein product [Fusarium graminearum]CZS83635.1 unnamed protein product [Fusarium graminearum]|eukprot:XP_011323570.1 hypothetical protein FGSG_12681 [Fusarium graminearum PH-1]
MAAALTWGMSFNQRPKRKYRQEKKGRKGTGIDFVRPSIHPHTTYPSMIWGSFSLAVPTKFNLSRSVARFVSRPSSVESTPLGVGTTLSGRHFRLPRCCSCLFRRLSPGPVAASLIPAALLHPGFLFDRPANAIVISDPQDSAFLLSTFYLALACLATATTTATGTDTEKDIDISPHTLPFPQSIKTSRPPPVIS